MTSLVELLDALRRWHVLEPGQLETLTRQWGQKRADPRAAVKKLVEQGWLTHFQANQLFKGRGGELVLGSYVLLELLGEGGMGAVYKARNWKLGHIVAVKLIRRERLTNPAAVRRFQREIRASAQLDHPNIVRALDADEVGGTHLLVMEYVADGQDLHKLVRAEGRLPVEQACRFIQQAALGLQHAFERGLVHRDIKPHNLLRSLVSGHSSLAQTARSDRQGLMTNDEGLIKILDFGLARLGTSDDDSSTLTQEGSVMGTLDYLAPEQARDSHTADIRSDLYSLGCTMYFLLTGQAPFPGGGAAEKMFKHQFNQPMPLMMLRPDVPEAVADIVDKLMAKQPEDRYQTPVELAMDLEAFLAGRPVRASGFASKAQTLGGSAALESLQDTQNPFAGLSHGDTAADEVAASAHAPPKSPIANRAVTPGGSQQRLLAMAAGGAVLFVLLIAGLIVVLNRPAPPTASQEPKIVEPKRPLPPSILDLAAAGEKESQAQEAAQLKKRAQERALRAKWIAGEEAIRKRRAADAETPYKALEAQFKDTKATFSSFARQLTAFQAKHGGTPAALQAAEMLTKLPSPLDRLDRAKIPQDARAAWNAARQDAADIVAVLGEHRWRHWGAAIAVAIATDGKRLASVGLDRVVRVWEASSGKELHSLRGHNADPNAVAFSRDGKLLASATAGDGIVKLWNVAAGKELLTIEAFPEAMENGKIKGGVWAELASVAFRADGKVLATAGYQKDASGVSEQGIKLWDVATGKHLRSLSGHQKLVMSVAFAPTGTLLASGSRDGTVKLWKTDEKTPPRTLTGLPGSVDYVAFSADGTLIAGQCNQGFMKVWDVASGKERADHAANGFAFLPDNLVLSIRTPSVQTLELWETDPPKRLPFWTNLPRPFNPVHSRSDGRLLALGGPDGVVYVWDIAAGKALPLSEPAGPARQLSFTLDLTRLAATYSGGAARLWNCQDGQAKLSVEGLHKEAAPVLSPDGKLMAGLAADGIPRLWSLDDGKELRRLGDAQASLWAFTPDGATIVATSGRNVQLFPTDPARREKSFSTLHEQGMTGLALTPDGTKALTCSWGSGTLRLINLETGAEERRYFDGEKWDGQAVAVAPDGRRAAAWLRSGGVKVFDLLALDESSALTLDANANRDGRPIALSFSPDGKLLATVDGDENVLLFDAASGRRISAWRLPGPVSSVAFAADGRHLATANANGTAYVLRIPPLPKALPADEAGRQQQDAARKLGVPPEIGNSIGMTLRFIPAGRFLMGDAGLPTSIGRPFYMGVHEATQAQYEKVTGRNPSHFHKGNNGGGEIPVESLSWEDAVAFGGLGRKGTVRDTGFRVVCEIAAAHQAVSSMPVPPPGFTTKKGTGPLQQCRSCPLFR